MAKRAERVAERARKYAERWRGYFQENINQYHEMFEFVYGKQWTDDEESMLKSFKKVPLTVNKLATLVNSLIGEQQQNTPQLQVVPLENCDYQTARIRELIVKDLMFTGGAKVAYQQAAIQAFVGGFGAFAIMTEYADPMSFDLDIVYKHFKDATKCYWDVGAERVNKTDGMYCGWITRMSRKKFREIYGKDIERKILPDDNSIVASKEEVALVTATDSPGVPFNWADEESVTIINHFERKYVKDTLYKLSNGRIVNQEELDEIIESSQERLQKIQMLEAQQAMILEQAQAQQAMQGMVGTMQPGMEDEGQGQSQIPEQQQMGIEETQQQMPPQGEQGMQVPQAFDEDVITLFDDGEPVTIIDKKDIKRHKIKHYKISGDYILEDTDFPSDQLPLVFVDQASWFNKNGKQVCRPFITDAKDTQRYLNYLATQSAYVLKVSRYDQWIGSKKNFSSSDTQQKWRDPLVVQGALTFDESPSGVTPQQVQPPELSQSLLTQYQRAIEDLYTGTGLYPTRMGQQGNELSGAAIDARTRQGSYVTFPAFNSINRAIAVGGEIVNEMIPRVYDTERVISIMSPSEGQQTFVVNQQLDDYGEIIRNDIRKGTYQVKLLPGPSYEGQKEQALQSFNAVLQANPQVFNMIADLYAENLPLTNTIELKNRLKILVPPDLLEAGRTGKPPERHEPSPEQQQLAIQQQQAEMERQFKLKELELKEQQLLLEQKRQQVDLQIQLEKLEAEKVEALGKIEGEKLRYLAETGRTQSNTAIAHADNLTKILLHKSE